MHYSVLSNVLSYSMLIVQSGCLAHAILWSSGLRMQSCNYMIQAGGIQLTWDSSLKVLSPVRAKSMHVKHALWRVIWWAILIARRRGIFAMEAGPIWWLTLTVMTGRRTCNHTIYMGVLCAAIKLPSTVWSMGPVLRCALQWGWAVILQRRQRTKTETGLSRHVTSWLRLDVPDDWTLCPGIRLDWLFRTVS
jgi:hypothetical protein